MQEDPEQVVSVHDVSEQVGSFQYSYAQYFLYKMVLIRMAPYKMVPRQ